VSAAAALAAFSRSAAPPLGSTVNTFTFSYDGASNLLGARAACPTTWRGLGSREVRLANGATNNDGEAMSELRTVKDLAGCPQRLLQNSPATKSVATCPPSRWLILW
jgi:hypothetical protein